MTILPFRGVFSPGAILKLFSILITSAKTKSVNIFEYDFQARYLKFTLAN